MIPSFKRLSGKDIAYMLRRGKKSYGKVFGCIVVDQYTNRSWHQAAFQIPVKCDKRAVVRNMLKRTAQSVFRSILEQQQLPYKKRFFFLNKNTLSSTVELLASSSKTTILKERKKRCHEDFTYLVMKQGTHSSPQSSRTIRK